MEPNIALGKSECVLIEAALILMRQSDKSIGQYDNITNLQTRIAHLWVELESEGK